MNKLTKLINLNDLTGLIITYPYGTFIKSKKKKIIIKSRNIKTIVGRNLLLIENKQGLGIIKLEPANKISISQFKKIYKYHRITESDRKKWWPDYRYLYKYKISAIHMFKVPILLDYITGPQITVKPPNITFKRILIGTSGYYYPQAYPTNYRTPNKMLEYYSNIFNSVEINSTFYQYPKPGLVNRLKKSTIKKFTIKVNRYITHMKQLNNINTLWKDFYKGFEPIHDRIFCFLFQFNDKFLCNAHNVDKIKTLAKTLKMLHNYHKFAFEFREKSWLTNPIVEKIFKKNNWTIVIANNYINGFEPKLKKYQCTSDLIYIRMHGKTGQYTGSYNQHDFKLIFDFVSKKKIKYAYIFFNNTDSNSDAIDNATSTIKKFNRANLL